MNQLDLFSTVCNAFAEHRSLSNRELYRNVANRLGITDAEVAQQRRTISGQQHNLFHRRIRWIQQTLKRGGLVERIPGERGHWQLTGRGRRQITQWAGGKVSLIAYSTELGVAILGDCAAAFSGLDQPVTLCITSPPYPLAKPRAYGNLTGQAYIDFICRALEPVVKALRPGGSVVLNVSNDIFVPGTPARSTYRERLVIALEDRLGLSKMDEVVWVNYSKPPAPVQWASLTRQQLNAAFEPVYWFTNNPTACLADNRRVLQPHTERHKALIARGGDGRVTDYGDGAYRLRPHSFGQKTPGRIPRNVLEIGHNCAGSRAVRAYCKANGLPTHGAPMPERLVSFFVELLSKVGDLVVDPMSGSGTVQGVAERLGRTWMASELVLEYVQAAGAARMDPTRTWYNPELFRRLSKSSIVPHTLAG